MVCMSCNWQAAAHVHMHHVNMLRMLYMNTSILQ